MMREWLSEAISSMSLSEEADGYLHARGMTSASVTDIGIVEWDHSKIRVLCSDPKFSSLKKGFGPRGENIDGRLIIPIWNPVGKLIGFESRSYKGEKKISQYLLPDASWNPVFIGLTKSAVEKIWSGCSVWIVEGLFDLAALQHGVPQGDVVLSTLRAHLSRNHVLFLKRSCITTVYIVYDNDVTGRKMTYGYVDPVTKKRNIGAVESLNRVGVDARAFTYTGGKDPGELWDHGGATYIKKMFGDVQCQSSSLILKCST